MCLVQTEVKRRYTSRSRGRIAAAVNVIETGNTKEEEAGHGCYATTSSAAFSIPICAVQLSVIRSHVKLMTLTSEQNRRGEMSSTLSPPSSSSPPPRSPSPIQLEPFVHQVNERGISSRLQSVHVQVIISSHGEKRKFQVGGHFPIVCLDGTTVCKPLNDREHREPRNNTNN